MEHERAESVVELRREAHLHNIMLNVDRVAWMVEECGSVRMCSVLVELGSCVVAGVHMVEEEIKRREMRVVR